MKCPIRLTVIMFSVIQLLNVPEALAWQKLFNGNAPESKDQAHDVVVDKSTVQSRKNHVLAVGSMQGADLGKSFTVLNLRGDNGQTLWKKNIRGNSPQGENWASAVTLDVAGNAVVAGTLSQTGQGKTFAVCKLRATDGSTLWCKPMNGTPVETNDEAHDVVVDRQGNVLAAGTLSYTDSGTDFAVLKFQGTNGALLWKSTLHNPSISGNAAFTLTVDNKNQIFAAGQTGNTYVGGAWITVVKINNATGAIQWRKNVWGGDFSRSGWANKIAVDTAGNVVVAGTLPYAGVTGPTRSFLVMKLRGTDGFVIWKKEFYGGDTAGYNYANDLAIDRYGHIYAAGVTDDNAGWRFALVKLNGNDGSKIWPAGLSASPLPIVAASAESLVLDSANNILAAGQVSSGLFNNALAVFKFNGATGQKIWGKSFPGNSFLDFSTAKAIALDSSANPVTAGFISKLKTGDDFATVKLRNANGDDY